MRTPPVTPRRRASARILALAMLLPALLATPAIADEPDPEPGLVEFAGTVTDADTGEALAGADVELIDDDHETTVVATTDGAGAYHFGTEPGAFAVVVSLDGYKPGYVESNFTAGDRFTLDFELEPEPVDDTTNGDDAGDDSDEVTRDVADDTGDPGNTDDTGDTGSTEDGDSLPRTGLSTLPLAFAALLAMASGGALLRASRRPVRQRVSR